MNAIKVLIPGKPYNMHIQTKMTTIVLYVTQWEYPSALNPWDTCHLQVNAVPVTIRLAGASIKESIMLKLGVTVQTAMTI